MDNWYDTLRLIFEQDYELEHAGDLKTAKEKINQQVFDLAILDVRLDDGDPDNIEGMQLLQHMRDLGDQTEAIVLTAYPEPDLVRRSLTDLNAHNFLFKNPSEHGFGEKDLRQLRESVQEAVKISQAKKKTSRVDYRDILIIEDDNNWVDLLEEILNTEGYTVDIANGLQEAKQSIETRKKSDKGPYRLAVTDLQLSQEASPDEEGAALLNTLTNKSPGTDIIIVTSFPSPRRVRNAFTQYKVKDFFSKNDFDIQDFIQTVRSCFEEVLERFLVAWVDEKSKDRNLQVGREYTLRVTCQKFRSSAYRSAPFWLSTSEDFIRLRSVVYAQDTDVRPSISQNMEVYLSKSRAQPLQFTLLPRKPGTNKNIAVDLYDEDRLLATLELKPISVVSP
jgi:DNA-binding NtrC family response regulator